MGEKVETKPTISLSEMATKLLGLLIFLEMFVPHLKAICITVRDQPWKAAGPIDVANPAAEVADAA